MKEKLCTTIIFYTEHFVVPFFLLNSLVAEKIKSLYNFLFISLLKLFLKYSSFFASGSYEYSCSGYLQQSYQRSGQSLMPSVMLLQPQVWAPDGGKIHEDFPDNPDFPWSQVMMTYQAKWQRQWKISYREVLPKVFLLQMPNLYWILIGLRHMNLILSLGDSPVYLKNMSFGSQGKWWSNPYLQN